MAAPIDSECVRVRESLFEGCTDGAKGHAPLSSDGILFFSFVLLFEGFKGAGSCTQHQYV